MDSKKTTIGTILPYGMAILAFLTFLFGENITSKLFSNTNLVMETKLINEYMPGELKNVVKENKFNEFSTLRIISIKNEGKATKNLRILLKLDGPVYFFDTNESIEVFKEKKLESDSTIVLSMERLSNDSTIELKVWLKNENKPFTASYTDDISTKVIYEKSQEIVIYYTIFYTAVSIIFIISILLIFYNGYHKFNSKRKEAERNNVVERVLSQLSESLDEEGNTDGKFSENETIETNTDKTKERLRELINRRNNS